MFGSCIEQVDNMTCGYFAKADIHVNVCHPRYHTFFPREDAIRYFKKDERKDPLGKIPTKIVKSVNVGTLDVTREMLDAFLKDVPKEAIVRIDENTGWPDGNYRSEPTAERHIVATWMNGGK